MEKMNCKHGLDRKQEIQARRLKDVLIGVTEDKDDALKNRIKELYCSFCKENDTEHTIFYYYISQKDPVLFSALRRCMKVSDFSNYMRKNNISAH